MYIVSKVTWGGLLYPIETFETLQQAKNYVKQNKKYKFIIEENDGKQ